MMQRFDPVCLDAFVALLGTPDPQAPLEGDVEEVPAAARRAWKRRGRSVTPGVRVPLPTGIG